MSTFSVSFTPEIPTGGEMRAPAKPCYIEVYRKIETGGATHVDMTFSVCGRAVSYYPADLVCVHDDLLGAISILATGGDHTITMSGYPVLLAEVGGDIVTFSDPYPHDPWRCEVAIGDVRKALQAAADDVWTFMHSFEDQSRR